MTVDELKIKDFRNYREEKFDFSPGINLIIGDNAQGKTGILEAVFFCAAGSSHRKAKDRELIRFGQEDAHIRLSLTRRNTGHLIDVHLKAAGRKGIAIDRQPLKKTAELFGMLTAVFFAPEDLMTVKNGPAARRDLTDTQLCQLDRNYAYELSQYNRALLQKSKLLKQINNQPELADTLEIWNEQLIRFGCPVIERRSRHIEALSAHIEKKNAVLSDGKERLTAIYEPNVRADDLPAALKKLKDREIAAGICLAGPHRDDVGFYINGADVRRFASQGQQRTTALSIKLSEIDMLKEGTGDTPVLLLDDVLSELDTGRQKRLLSGIGGIQTLVTSTGFDAKMQQLLKTDKTFIISDGRQINTAEVKDGEENGN